MIGVIVLRAVVVKFCSRLQCEATFAQSSEFAELKELDLKQQAQLDAMLAYPGLELAW